MLVQFSKVVFSDMKTKWKGAYKLPNIPYHLYFLCAG